MDYVGIYYTFITEQVVHDKARLQIEPYQKEKAGDYPAFFQNVRKCPASTSAINSLLNLNAGLEVSGTEMVHLLWKS